MKHPKFHYCMVTVAVIALAFSVYVLLTHPATILEGPNHKCVEMPL